MHRIPTGLVAIALAACTDPAPTTGGTSIVATVDVALQAPPTFDILFVVDDSPAMATYPAVATGLASLVHQLGFGTESFHIGVVTTDLADDGLLRRRADGLAYIASTGLPDGGRDGNITGDLLPVFGQLADVGVRGSAVRSALETMRRALDGRNRGFRRAGAGLTVVFVLAGDDASVDAPAAYRNALGNDAFVATAIAGPSPRMTAFLDPQLQATAPLGADFASQLSIERGKMTLQGGPCVATTSDVCTFAYAEPGGGGAVIPACADTEGQPCWRLVDDPECGSSVRTLRIARPVPWWPFERDPRMAEGTRLIGQCLVD